MRPTIREYIDQLLLAQGELERVWNGPDAEAVRHALARRQEIRDALEAAIALAIAAASGWLADA